MWAVANETATHIDKLIESKKSETTKTNFYKVNFEQLVRKSTKRDQIELNSILCT